MKAVKRSYFHIFTYCGHLSTQADSCHIVAIEVIPDTVIVCNQTLLLPIVLPCNRNALQSKSSDVKFYICFNFLTRVCLRGVSPCLAIVPLKVIHIGPVLCCAQPTVIIITGRKGKLNREDGSIAKTEETHS